MVSVETINWAIRLWAEISGTTMPLVAVSVNHGMNAIPDCHLTIPLGREFHTGEPSPIHAVAEDLDVTQPCFVYCEMTVIGGTENGLGQTNPFQIPDGPFLLFEGYINGGGFTKAQGSASYTLSLIHWTSVLTRSSIFSKSSHVANPGSYTYGALMEADETGSRDWTDLSQASNYIDELDDDLWQSCLFPWMEHMCQQDVLWVQERDLRPGGKNDAALEALQRFKGDTTEFYQALKLAVSPDQDTKEAIGQHVVMTSRNPENLAHHTLWDLLVGKFASDFLFAVVPRIHDALIVPFIPGARDYAVTIAANEYTNIAWTGQAQQPIRAVGILSSIGLGTGADLSPDNLPSQAAMGAGGWFAGSEVGQVLIQQGPPWAGQLLATNLYSDAASGGDGDLVDDAVEPGVAAAKNNAREASKTRGTDVIKPFLDRYAQSVYATEMIKNRQMVLTCPFRLDLAPGSSVRVMGSPEQYTPGDALGRPMIGQVLRVSLALDAEARTAGCGIHLGYLRREGENSTDAASVAAHPLYEATFIGAPLHE